MIYFALNPAYAIHLTPGKSLLYSINEPNDCLTLNKEGVLILQRCDGTSTLEDIVAALKMEFDEEGEMIRNYVIDYLERLKNENILISRNVLKEAPVVVTGNSKISAPITLNIEVTWQSVTGPVRPYAGEDDDLSISLEKEEIDRLLEEAGKLGIPRICLRGGEFFEHPGAMTILEEVCTRFSRTTLYTNGYHLNKRMVKKIASFPGLDVLVPLAGGEEWHNQVTGNKKAFSRALKCIMMMSQQNIDVSAMMYINSTNIGQMEKTVKALRETRCPSLKYQFVYDCGEDVGAFGKVQDVINLLTELYGSRNFDIVYREQRIFDILKRKYRKNCGAGYLNLHLRANGEVTPCFHFPYALGNVKTSSLEEIMVQENIGVFRSLTCPSEKECEECENFSFCYGCLARGMRQPKKCAWKRRMTRLIKTAGREVSGATL